MNRSYVVTFILLLVAQTLLCNFMHLTRFLYPAILPAMIVMLPTKRNTISALFIAFICAMVVDLFADGVAGLNTLALLPVAFLRKELIRLIFGNEVYARGEDISMTKGGFVKMSALLTIVLSIFLAIYIVADGAGTRPLWYDGIRFGVSLVFSYAASLMVCYFLDTEPATRWK